MGNAKREIFSFLMQYVQLFQAKAHLQRSRNGTRRLFANICAIPYGGVFNLLYLIETTVLCLRLELF